jgi:hypothetical protein
MMKTGTPTELRKHIYAHLRFVRSGDFCAIAPNLSKAKPTNAVLEEREEGW